MFPEKNIALLKIQTLSGQTFVTVQTFMPLDKRINARLFRDPQLLYSPIFLSLSFSLSLSLFSPGARKSQTSALNARVKGLVLARAQPSPLLPPHSPSE